MPTPLRDLLGNMLAVRRRLGRLVEAVPRVIAARAGGHDVRGGVRPAVALRDQVLSRAPEQSQRGLATSACRQLVR
jgi:hypothetical protein